MSFDNDGRQIKVGCCGFAATERKYFERFKVIEIRLADIISSALPLILCMG